MTHTVREKKKLLARVSRIRGQIEAVERAIGEGKGCYDVLQTVTAARGALNSLVAEMSGWDNNTFDLANWFRDG